MKKLNVLKRSLGIDVSKRSLSICLGVLNEDLEKEFLPFNDVSNDKEGFKILSKWLKSQGFKNDTDVIVMEATGVYHEGIAVYLYELGYKVSIMQSGRVKRYAQSLDQRSKTDALDSKMLSMLGCERKLTSWNPPSEVFKGLKSLSRERSALVSEKSTVKNRKETLEDAHNPNKKSIKRYAKRLQLLNEQIKEIEDEMQEMAAQDIELTKKLAHLISIPGVSFITAITVVAETNGFEFFTNAKQLASYVGYDVVIRDSGTFKGKTKISKKGNRYIRAVLHMPSMSAIRVNPTLKPFYQRLKLTKVKPIIALVAVQRKMLTLMFSMWKSDQCYDPEFEQKKAAKNQVLAAQDRNKNEFVTS